MNFVDDGYIFLGKGFISSYEVSSIFSHMDFSQSIYVHFYFKKIKMKLIFSITNFSQFFTRFPYFKDFILKIYLKIDQ